MYSMLLILIDFSISQSAETKTEIKFVKYEHIRDFSRLGRPSSSQNDQLNVSINFQLYAFQVYSRYCI